MDETEIIALAKVFASERPSVFQNTIETPLYNSYLESISGDAESQFDNNREIINHIKNYKSVKTVDSLPTDDIKKDVIYYLTQDDGLNKIGVYYYGEDNNWYLLSRLTPTLKIIPISEDESIDEFDSIPKLTRDEFMRILNAYNDNDTFIILSNHNDMYRHHIIDVIISDSKYTITTLDFQNKIYIKYSASISGSENPRITVESLITKISNTLTSESTKEALSANMGKYIGDTLANLKSIGHFLSIWDCTTGLPFDDPQEAPYPYETGMFYLVGKTAQSAYQNKIKKEFVNILNKDSINPEILNYNQLKEVWKKAAEIVGPIKNEINYKPSGTQYSPGIPSTEEETDDVNVGDFYWYSGTGWQLLDNTSAKITFSNIRGLPSDNSNLDTALKSKLDKDTNTSVYPKVYGKDTDGTQNEVIYTPDAYANSIVKRDANNRFRVAAPSVAGDVANKGYVDGAVEEGVTTAVNNVKEWLNQNAIDIKYTDGTIETIVRHYVASVRTNWGGLCFEGAQDNSTVKYVNYNGNTVDMKYSKDAINWFAWEPDTNITLMNGQRVYVKGNNPNRFDGWIGSTFAYTKIEMTGKIKASGSVMSLLDDGEGTLDTIPNTACFANLFQGCASLLTPPKLPATTLKTACYGYNYPGDYHTGGMFNKCTNLQYAPELPATTLASGCYSHMFSECANLQYSPPLPATTLAGDSVYYMFYRCPKLERVEINFTVWGYQNWSFLDSAGTQATNPTIVVPYNMDVSVRNVNSIPPNWRILKKGVGLVSNKTAHPHIRPDWTLTSNDKVEYNYRLLEVSRYQGLWGINYKSMPRFMTEDTSTVIFYDGAQSHTFISGKDVGRHTFIADFVNKTSSLDDEDITFAVIFESVSANNWYIGAISYEGWRVDFGSNAVHYGWKHYRDNELIHDLIAVIDTETAERGMYDRVTGNLLQNAGTGTDFGIEVTDSDSNLYTQIPSLEAASSNTAANNPYINTGVAPYDGTNYHSYEMEVDIKWNAIRAGRSFNEEFGHTNSRWSFGRNKNTGNYRFGQPAETETPCSTTSFDNVKQSATSVSGAKPETATLIINETDRHVVGAVGGLGANESFYLFNSKSNYPIDYFGCDCMVKHAKFKLDDITVRNYIPAKTTINDVEKLGMIDIVKGEFVTNANTGADFTIGD